MPPIHRYEWLCLRALRPRQCRDYTTSQTSTLDETNQNSTPPPAPSETPSTRIPDHLRSYLEEQDTIALANLKSKVQQIQTNAALAETLLSSWRESASTVQLIPSIPAYKINPYRISTTNDTHLLSQNLHNRAQTVLDNIWDLENSRYPYEKGPSTATKYKEEVKALVERGVKKEIEAERTETRNRVDVYRKRYAQKVDGLRGIVDEMRRGMGLGPLRRTTSAGSVVGGFRTGLENEGVEEMRISFAKKDVRENEDTAAAAGEATVGAAKVEAEADAINSVNATEVTPESADTIGTAKIEAEAEVAKSAATTTRTATTTATEPTTYTPMCAASKPPSPPLTPSEPEITIPNPPTKPATAKKTASSSAKKPQRQPQSTKSKEPKDSTISRLNQLLRNLENKSLSPQAAAAQKTEDIGYGQTATQIEEKKDMDEKRGNPFAR